MLRSHPTVQYVITSISRGLFLNAKEAAIHERSFCGTVMKYSPLLNKDA